MRHSITIVPFYESLGADAISFVLNQTELTTICLEDKFISLIAKLKREGKIPHVRNIVSYDPLSEQKVKEIQDADMKSYNFWDLVEVGKVQKEVYLEEPTPDSVYMFCYTSGTTGDPKGVILTHKTFIACAYVDDHFQFNFEDTDVTISYLPYGHTFEQCFFVLSLLRGFAHGYYSGDPLKLLDDIQTLKPTIFCTVPRILNRVYTKIHESIATKGKFTQWLFNRAVESKKYYYERDGNLKYTMYDKTVFAKIRQQFGGNIRYMLSASAPVSAEVLQFYKLALGIHVYEVYGQTENNGPATCTHPLDKAGQSVGGVIPSLRLRLKDVPELGYLTSDNPPKGEVQLKGHNIFKGYFKNPEKTQEVLTEDGWLNTGDVGVILPNGAIRIIDRAKNIFKLSQGEYIAPEKLENIYAQCPVI